jgi:hypothetical protein
MSGSLVELPALERGAVVVYLSVSVIVVRVVEGLSPPADRDLGELRIER